jgi:hypothetical protein
MPFAETLFHSIRHRRWFTFSEYGRPYGMWVGGAWHGYLPRRRLVWCKKETG